MRIRVLYFAVFRERLSRDREEIELPEGARVKDALHALEAQHRAVADLHGLYRVAVNQDMVPESHPLKDGDELVLVPPVSGGMPRHIDILDAPLSLDRVVAAVRGPSVGGIATFTGTVRDHSQGRDVERLEYEAYRDMALKVFESIAEEIEREWPQTRVAVEHRIGRLGIGDAAVVIACGAPHRAEAFAGCRAMIDRLKERAPIWKKETGPDGDEWVGLGP